MAGLINLEPLRNDPVALRNAQIWNAAHGGPPVPGATSLPQNPGGGSGSRFSFNFGNSSGFGGTGGGPGLGNEGGVGVPSPIFGPVGGGASPRTDYPLPTPQPGLPPISGTPVTLQPPPAPRSSTGTRQSVSSAILNNLPAILSLIGRATSAQEAGRYAGRTADTQLLNQYDTLNLGRTNQYLNRAGAELQQRQFISNEADRNRTRAVLGSTLPNLQDIQFTGLPDRVASHIPTVTGGLRPSAIGHKQEIGDLVYNQAMEGLQNPYAAGTAPEGTPNRLAALPEPPPLSDRPQAGAADTALNWASLIGTYGSLGLDIYNAIHGRPTTPAATPPAGTPPAGGGSTPPATGATNLNVPFDPSLFALEPTPPKGPNVSFTPINQPVDRPGNLYDPMGVLQPGGGYLPRISGNYPSFYPTR